MTGLLVTQRKRYVMTAADGTAAQVTLSGRELALMRRKALALHGKAGSAHASAQRQSGPAAAARSAMATSRPVAATAGPRQTAGLVAEPKPASCGCDGSGTGAASGTAAVIAQHSSGRQAAMRRRAAHSLVGRGDGRTEAPRPSGRVRARHETATVPDKVALGHTLAGRPVSGTTLDGTRKVTGTEAGSCRNITGTEYLGLEQFATLCGTRPAPGASKVGVSSTLREQKVTGTEVGRSAHVTGDEVGACRGITGTEYLAREHFEAACGPSSALPGPGAVPARKGSVMSSPGASRSAGSEAPSKVARVLTGAGSTVTGTELARSERVTGDGKGFCRPVTGTEYIGPRQLQTTCVETSPVAPVAKVGQDQTWSGQTITGSPVGRARRVTGDEPGGCAPISGTPYIGRGQYQAFCEPPALASQQALIRSEAVISAAAVSGDRPGAGGRAMTGDERGACGTISGTPYIGRDNAPLNCPPASARFVPRERIAEAAPATAAPADFSIRPPARQAQERGAQERGAQAVTGTGFGSQRITGPINKAGGLITGTPEFRHHEAAPTPQAEAPASAAMRLTGEGSQAGTRISGDAWQASGRVTGTEGTSALARNPSQRGPSRAMGMNAQQFRDVERAAPPESRITGSSGNTAKGAAVTLSGGARG